MRETLWVFAYDIRSNKRRTAVATALEDSGGVRVNLSVFEVWASRSGALAIHDALASHLQRSDKLVRYRVCASCRADSAGADAHQQGPNVID